MFCPDCGTWNRAAAVRCSRCTVDLPELADAPLEKPNEELLAVRSATGGRYRVYRRLATGGMAHVYLATHGELGRPVVIKVLLAHLSRDEEMRERFRREAEAASRLTHPHIAGILDFGTIDETVYIVMPYLAGGSLADLLVRDRTIKADVAASVAAQVAVALDYSARRGIVHRDIKPDNILFDEEGYAHVTDFGIATARFHNRLTATGRAMGTPHYMSPEQAMGKLVDGRSDIYAMGVLLYEMLVGFPPFDGADAYSIGYKHVHEQPTPPDIVDSTTPTGLSAIIMQCLAKQPAERFQRGNDLADALIGYLSQTDDLTSHRSAWLSRRLGITPVTR